MSGHEDGDAARWLAYDIGGANIKAAHSSGKARTLPFELWKRPDDLSLALRTLRTTLPEADRVAVTMTAELCDCYDSKVEGVLAVLDAVLDVFASKPIRVWGTDGRFHSVPDIQASPELAAAANWLALATVAARLLPEGPGLLIDIGTTTSDLVPIQNGRPVARGRSDLTRLQNGELLYAGVRRTPLCAVAHELPVRGVPTGLAAELFASTLDVFLVLGEIPGDPRDLSTADGRPATGEAARGRLARMVGADREGFTAEDATAFAWAAEGALLDRLAMAAERACGATIGRPNAAIVAGSGAFLGRKLASRLVAPGGTVLDLHERWGPSASSAGCAHALVVLASEGTEA
jgi:probable H4MPT-linked C1 transfer pathway protein